MQTKPKYLDVKPSCLLLPSLPAGRLTDEGCCVLPPHDKPHTDLLPLKRIPEHSVMSAGGSNEWVGDDALNGDGKREEVEVLSGPSLIFPLLSVSNSSIHAGRRRRRRRKKETVFVSTCCCSSPLSSPLPPLRVQLDVAAACVAPATCGRLLFPPCHTENIREKKISRAETEGEGDVFHDKRTSDREILAAVQTNER